MTSTFFTSFHARPTVFPYGFQGNEERDASITSCNTKIRFNNVKQSSTTSLCIFYKHSQKETGSNDSTIWLSEYSIKDKQYLSLPFETEKKLLLLIVLNNLVPKLYSEAYDFTRDLTASLLSNTTL